MIREIIQIGDARLAQPSQAILPKKITSDEVQALIQDLVDTCQSYGDETAGLSAVQVGVLKRVFVVRRIDLEPEEWEVMINPEVEVLDNRQTEYWEGCMSIGAGDSRLFGPVARAKRVKVKYLDRNGQAQELEAADYLAHIILHEDDHLEGKLFLQYISNPQNIWKGGDLDEYLEKHGHYPEVE